MDIKDSEKLIESTKKRPLKTIFTILVFLIMLSMIAFFRSFFDETGKRIVGLLMDTPRVEQPPKHLTDEQKAKPQPTINQHTEGDQAPIVNVGPGGKSTINYGSTTDKGARE